MNIFLFQQTFVVRQAVQKKGLILPVIVIKEDHWFTHNTPPRSSNYTQRTIIYTINTWDALQIQDRSCKHVLRFRGTGPIQCNITFSQAQKHG